MNKTVFKNTKSREPLKLYDISIFLLIISSLAFRDVKLVFLGFQAIAIAMSFVYGILNRLKQYIAGFLLWLIIFAFYSCSSILWASQVNTTVFSCTLSIIQVGLIALCILFYVTDYVRWLNVVKSFVIGAVIIVIRFFITIPVSQWGQGERFNKSTIFGSNGTAIMLSYAAIFLMWFLIINKQNYSSKIKVGISILIVLFVAVSFLMGTRKGVLIVALGFSLLMLFTVKSPLKLLSRIFAVLIISIIIYYIIMNVPVFYNSIGYRIESMMQAFIGGETDSSTASREFFIQDAFDIFLKNPIVGIGHDGYRYTNIYGYYAHNNYVELLANLGIIGFVSYYSIYFLALKKAIKIRKINIIPFTFIILILVLDFGLVSYSSEYVYILLAIILSCIHLNSQASLLKGND